MLPLIQRIFKSEQRGFQELVWRFPFGHNIHSVRRDLSDAVVQWLSPRSKQIPTDRTDFKASWWELQLVFYPLYFISICLCIMSTWNKQKKNPEGKRKESTGGFHGSHFGSRQFGYNRCFKWSSWFPLSRWSPGALLVPVDSSERLFCRCCSFNIKMAQTVKVLCAKLSLRECRKNNFCSGQNWCWVDI